MQTNSFSLTLIHEKIAVQPLLGSSYDSDTGQVHGTATSTTFSLLDKIYQLIDCYQTGFHNPFKHELTTVDHSIGKPDNFFSIGSSIEFSIDVKQTI